MTSCPLLILLGGCALAGPVVAGDLNAPALPTDPASAMYTLEDLYKRLEDGTEGSPRPGLFAEPAAGPGGTMHTLTDIMNKMPEGDNTDGAKPEHVLDDKTFWGLTTGVGGAWGEQTGTMPNIGAQNITPGTSPQTISAGYHNGEGQVAGDADLAPVNIKSGVTIFGVSGDPNVVDTTSGDATASELLFGKKAWVDGSEITGNIVTQTVSNATTSQSAGYYNAFDLATVDSDLMAANIKSGVDIFGVVGKITVSIVIPQTVNNTTTSQIAGYYDAFDLATVDSDLMATNIKPGVDIFGVVGTYTSTGPTFSAPFPVAKTGQTTTYAAGDDGDLEKGVAWPNPRFSDNSNGTVTDNLTGLVWLQNANCDGTKQWAAAMTWAAALANGSCGLTDNSVPGQWRLPTIKELSSLVNAGAVSPSLPAGHPFTGVQSYGYWSSTTYAPSTSIAWGVYLNGGDVGASGKTGYNYVWPVRGGL